MKAINYAYFKLEEKTIWSIKENKNNFINVMEKKIAIIRTENFIL